MENRARGYIASALIASLAFIMPAALRQINGIDVSVRMNSGLWFWLVLMAAFLGFAFWYSKASIWLKVLAIYCLVACFFTRAVAVSYFMYVSFVAVLYFYLLCRDADYNPILKTIQSIFFLNILLFVMQRLGQDNLLNFGLDAATCSGAIGNEMQFASFAMCMAPLLLVYKKLNIVPLALVAGMSGSSGAVIALGAGVGIYLLLKFRGRLRIALVSAILLVVGLYVFKDNPQAWFILGDRLPVWKKTIQLANDYPLVGWGLGTFKVFFHALCGAQVQGGPLLWYSAHNFWLDMLFEVGRLGLGIVLGFAGYLVWLFTKVIKTEVAIVVFAGLAMLAVDLTVHFPARMAPSVLIIVAFIAFYENILRGEIKNGRI